MTRAIQQPCRHTQAPLAALRSTSPRGRCRKARRSTRASLGWTTGCTRRRCSSRRRTTRPSSPRLRTSPPRWRALVSLIRAQSTVPPKPQIHITGNRGRKGGLRHQGST